MVAFQIVSRVEDFSQKRTQNEVDRRVWLIKCVAGRVAAASFRARQHLLHHFLWWREQRTQSHWERRQDTLSPMDGDSVLDAIQSQLWASTCYSGAVWPLFDPQWLDRSKFFSLVFFESILLRFSSGCNTQLSEFLLCSCGRLEAIFYFYLTFTQPGKFHWDEKLFFKGDLVKIGSSNYKVTWCTYFYA